MPKRKSSAALAQPSPLPLPDMPLQAPVVEDGPPLPKRRASARKVSQTKASMNPGQNPNVLDGPQAFRASPDADTKDERMDLGALMDVDTVVEEKDDSLPSLVTNGDSDSPLSDMSEMNSPVEAEAPPVQVPKKGGKAKSASTAPDDKPAAPAKAKKEAATAPQFLDPEADGEEEADEEEIKEALSRPPPVNSDYLPLPWTGRLGYACLNTYLRFSSPPVFSSRTCRIASILENRHPLREPDEPPHATKNRPDRDQPASVRRGQEFVEQLCLANVRDIPKMLRWNDRYGIKFMRLSSEMFPFASHEEYGYKLAPFASEALADAGKVATELGHRLTTHPGQFTQLGSPRKSVIDNALRDLDYHAEMLSLLKLPPQQDRDAVMILHLGGVFGDKEATLARFRENYTKLPQHVKDRLVLENDDVSWSVHDLLPVCEELNIPLVLDYHHHNIIFDKDQIREGTKDIVELYPRILATWQRKNITPKMHYSEPTPEAITGRQRRKHSPRVATLPPVPEGVDLMIEAKDKEQAVFELMRTFKLPGFERFNDMLPHARKDENKPVKPTPKKRKTPKKKKADADSDDELPEPEPAPPEVVPEDEVGMGGSEGRVYWPPGQEHWLRPMKKVVKPKAEKKAPPGKELDEEGRIITPAMKRKRAAAAAAAAVGGREAEAAQGAEKAIVEGEQLAEDVEAELDRAPKKSGKGKGKGGRKGQKAAVEEGERLARDVEVGMEGDKLKSGRGKGKPEQMMRKRQSRAKKVDYAEHEGEEEE